MKDHHGLSNSKEKEYLNCHSWDGKISNNKKLNKDRTYIDDTQTRLIRFKRMEDALSFCRSMGMKTCLDLINNIIRFILSYSLPSA